MSDRFLSSLHDAEKALRQSEQRFRLLLDSTAEAIYGLDTEGFVEHIVKPATLDELARVLPPPRAPQ